MVFGLVGIAAYGARLTSGCTAARFRRQTRIQICPCYSETLHGLQSSGNGLWAGLGATHLILFHQLVEEVLNLRIAFEFAFGI
jgi:hypothetical protein